jgi:hypothetical protein
MDLNALPYISISVHENVIRLAIIVRFVKSTEILEGVIKLAIRNGKITGRDRFILIFL